eukprot:gnl/Trimastix_PCT/69.p2 GENE.gnl/Trimastix_PCT/69~~gnl/Trimastix_PCT/69.p2  ORF type:complete len:321 (+),score=88.39 gnl/Trimastix_PCT/69:57-1019(+)
MPAKTPKEAFQAIVNASKAKAAQPWHKTFVLGILAGAYIAFGGFLAIRVAGNMPNSDVGVQKLMFGSVFPVGLMLVIMCGAELFTGNTMFMVAGVCNKNTGVKVKHLVKNWCISYLGNFVGSIFVAFFLVWLTNLIPYGDQDNVWTKKAIAIATAKCNGYWHHLFFRAIGCNWLVCLAIYLAVVSSDTIGKIFGIWWPIMAFVALGYEHCVANMFFVPLGLMLGAPSGWTGFGMFLGVNLTSVTLGNIIGGALLVGVTYSYLHLDFTSAVPAPPKPAQEPVPVPAAEVKAQEMDTVTVAQTPVDAAAISVTSTQPAPSSA